MYIHTLYVSMAGLPLKPSRRCHAGLHLEGRAVRLLKQHLSGPEQRLITVLAASCR